MDNVAPGTAVVRPLGVESTTVLLWRVFGVAVGETQVPLGISVGAWRIPDPGRQLLALVGRRPNRDRSVQKCYL